MVTSNISIVTSDRVAENHTFFLGNTDDIMGKKQALARNEEVKLQPFVQENSP